MVFSGHRATSLKHHLTQTIKKIVNHKRQNAPTGLYSSFLKGQGHQGIPRQLYIFTRAFQGHQGNDQGAWRQSPSLPP